ncbi:MAG: type 4a pilus biogenesis protein PilO [bacterium]|nr:type 4a pilus biogenesis protein PilO [bacterium]
MNKFNSPANLIEYAPIITIVSFLIVIVTTVAILWPKFQELKIIQKNIEEKRLELQTKEEYFLKLSETKTKLEGYQEEVSRINSALPDNPSLPSLFNYLQKTSSESGLVLEKISPFTVSFSEDFPNLQETVFNIGVTGSYLSFRNFLSILEKSSRLIGVENISFSSPEEKESFVFDLKLKVYSY